MVCIRFENLEIAAFKIKILTKILVKMATQFGLKDIKRIAIFN